MNNEELNINNNIINNNNINNNSINNKVENNENQIKKDNSLDMTQSEKEKENFPDLEKTLLNSMKLEMARTNEKLSESQSKINELFQENNKLKLLQIENSKILSIKEDIINSNKMEINRLQTKNNLLETENESKKQLIQELNYKIIELMQKIESLESINKISEKIQGGEPNINDKEKYLLELNKLYNKINEIEIKNSKLNFDNKNLENRMELMKTDHKNEIEMIELLHKKKIENFEKNIANLNNTINELINENKKQPKEINYNDIQNEIYKTFSELEHKLRKFDNDNFLYKKENQKLKNENEELKIIINGKETIINKLQSNISHMENDFKIKLSQLNASFESPINRNKNEILKANNNNMRYQETIKDLINEQHKLMEENEILRTNYEQMTLGVNEANELFINKQKEYDKIINYQNEKLKEYKFKISLLKIKINELHSEKQLLEEKQMKNQNNFYQNFNNDNIYPNFDKDQNSIDFNFTPDQINLINSYPINNQNNLNYKINNLNEDEK